MKYKFARIFYNLLLCGNITNKIKILVQFGKSLAFDGEKSNKQYNLLNFPKRNF